MRVVVMGAGAIGSLFGGLLAADHEVVLVGRAPHVAAIGEHGLTITGVHERTVQVQATTETANLAHADVLLLTVKAHSTQQALVAAGEAVGPETFVCSLQNGLGNLQAVTERVGEHRVIAASTSHGCIFHAPGHVEHTGTGETVLGPPLPPDLPVHHELAQAFTEAGIETRVVPDMRPELWAKAAVNAAINPITAITGLPNGALVDLPELAELSRRVALEVEAVGRGRGLEVEEGRWADKARAVAKATAKNRSSMLQDIQNGKRTEIDAICGQIAALAEEAGVPAELNRALHGLVKGIEATLHYDP